MTFVDMCEFKQLNLPYMVKELFEFDNGIYFSYILSSKFIKILIILELKFTSLRSFSLEIWVHKSDL